jgi:LacI family transcriptional regulator
MIKTGSVPKRVTITDVAKNAGVSIKTVSRVVNKEPNVTDKTRAKVDKAIEALGFLPNLSARSLAGNRSYSVGLLYENPHEFSYMRDVLNGVFKTCTDGGYSLLLRPCKFPASQLMKDIRLFLQQVRVDGVILAAPLGDVKEVVELLQSQGILFAQIAPKRENPDWTWVQSDDLEASNTLTDYIVSLGHKRIGFIKGHPDHGATRLRYKGYRSSLKRHGIEFDTSLVSPGLFDFESGKKAAHSLLSLEEPPTAIIASNDDMASGVIHVAHELGLKIPESLSVAGFDDTPLASQLWPRLTTVKQPIFEMASLVTKLLIDDIRGIIDSDHHENFAFDLIVRESTARLNKP